MLNFILGMLFAMAIEPIVLKLVEWFECKINLSLSSMAVKTSYMQKEIDDMNNVESANLIRFQVEDDEYEEC